MSISPILTLRDIEDQAISDNDAFERLNDDVIEQFEEHPDLTQVWIALHRHTRKHRENPGQSCRGVVDGDPLSDSDSTYPIALCLESPDISM